jgi:hypothetical protein
MRPFTHLVPVNWFVTDYWDLINGGRFLGLAPPILSADYYNIRDGML